MRISNWIVALFAGNNTKKKVPTKRRLTVETLENRLAPAVAHNPGTKTLFVNGTGRADRVIITQPLATDPITINDNGVVRTFPRADVAVIRVSLGAGNDVLNAAGLKTARIIAFGGPGSDNLIGGGQNDELYGYNPNNPYDSIWRDWLRGGRGTDRMHGGISSPYHHGLAPFDIIARGPNDRLQGVVDQTAFLHRDPTDGPAVVIPAIVVTPPVTPPVNPPVNPPVDPPVTPTLYTIQMGGAEAEVVTGSQPGERIADLFSLQSASNAKLYEIKVRGIFNGVTDLRFTYGVPGGNEAGTAGAVTVVPNTDGTMTLKLVTPLDLSPTARLMQIRFWLPDGRRVHIYASEFRVTSEDVIAVHHRKWEWN